MFLFRSHPGSGCFRRKNLQRIASFIWKRFGLFWLAFETINRESQAQNERARLQRHNNQLPCLKRT